MARPTLYSSGTSGKKVFAVHTDGPHPIRIPMTDGQDLRNWPDGYGPVLEVEPEELAAIPTPSGKTGLDTL